MKEVSERYIFLDFLRFVAATAVVSQHAFQQVFPAFGHFTSNYMNIGIFGVTLFFIVSGFIIPASIEKYNTLKKFWISRIFRLFPLYLTIIFCTLVLIYFGIIKDLFPSLPTVIANIVMFAKFLGQPLIYRSFWTLNIEIIFYAIVSGIFVLGWIKRSLMITYIALIVTFVLGVIGTAFFGLFDKGWGTCLNIATMFVGTVYFRKLKNEISNKAFYMILFFTVLMVFNITFWNLIYKSHALLKFLPYATATLGAFIVFTICFYLKDLRYPKILVYMGVISYSIYLNQEIIFKLIPKTDNDAFTIILWLSSIIALSVFTYTFIEKPFMQLGRSVKKVKSIEVEKMEVVATIK